MANEIKNVTVNGVEYRGVFPHQSKGGEAKITVCIPKGARALDGRKGPTGWITYRTGTMDEMQAEWSAIASASADPYPPAHESRAKHMLDGSLAHLQIALGNIHPGDSELDVESLKAALRLENTKGAQARKPALKMIRAKLAALGVPVQDIIAASMLPPPSAASPLTPHASRPSPSAALTVIPASNVHVIPRRPDGDDVLAGGPALPRWLSNEARGLFREVMEIHWKTVEAAQQFAIGAVITGSALHELKRAVGRGRWEDFAREHIETRGMKIRMIRMYMQAADMAKGKLSELHRRKQLALDPRKLLAAPADLKPEHREAFRLAMGDITDATTWHGLLGDLAVGRPRREKGGYHAPVEMVAAFSAEHKLMGGYEEWPPATQAEFREWRKAEVQRQRDAAEAANPLLREQRLERRAIGIWQPIMAHMQEQGLEAASWRALPPAARADLAKLLEDLAAKIRATLGKEGK